MINSVYGKTVENLRKSQTSKQWKRFFHWNFWFHFLFFHFLFFSVKHTSRPTPITHKIFDKNYAAIHEIKPVLTLNKPIYVGFTVLELSKWLMYDFHYNFIKKHAAAELLFADTDILTHEIKSEVFMKIFSNTNICLTLAIFQKTPSFMIAKMKRSLAKWNMYTKEFRLINLLD